MTTEPVAMRALILLARKHPDEFAALLESVDTATTTMHDRQAEAAHVAYLADLAAKVGAQDVVPHDPPVRHDVTP